MLTDAGHDDDKPTNDAPDCPSCNGLGGYDASTDCEVYDDWQECSACEGTGKRMERDDFDPKRDAWTPND